MGNFDLIIFDLDGTLVEYKTGEILPGVEEWFEANPYQRFAIATNQGGVGLRHWMALGGFGNPDAYPSADEVVNHIASILNRLPILHENVVSVEICFAYQSKQGAWAPTPPVYAQDPRWHRERRKPAPGMLLDAMEKAGVKSHKTLMVGDWEEDRLAALAAGCAFVRADVFFGWQADAGEDES